MRRTDSAQRTALKNASIKANWQRFGESLSLFSSFWQHMSKTQHGCSRENLRGCEAAFFKGFRAVSVLLVRRTLVRVFVANVLYASMQCLCGFPHGPLCYTARAWLLYHPC